MTTSILVTGGTGRLRRPVAQRLRDVGATPVRGPPGRPGHMAGPAHAGQSAAATEGSRCREAATARAISVRRMSRKVTGTAASAVSPVTQNAHWNPPVSAVAAACP